MQIKIYSSLFWFLLFVLLPGKDVFAVDVNMPVLNSKGITQSLECAKCHKDIYSTWNESLHAKAAENPVFTAAFLQVYFERSESARTLCLRCHAPVTAINNDFKLGQGVTREGVNCDYCHSIAEITSQGPRFEFDLLKQGPLRDVTSPVHKTRFNELFKQSQLCAHCHDLETANGLKLIETYTEWKQGPYPAKGTQCQDCHMRKVAGKIVAPEVKQTPEKTISSHDIAGGHSTSKREESVGIKITDIARHKQKIVVAIDVTNKGAGHKIPTGIPTKKIVLQVSIQSKNGETYQMQKKIYQKLLADENGQPVISDSDIFLGKAVKIVSDNRIAPLETRREKFTFFVPDEKDQKISAAVFYEHNPKIIQSAPIHIKLHEVIESIGH